MRRVFASLGSMRAKRSAFDSVSPSARKSSKEETPRNFLVRLLREPLLHFVVLGALLFAISAALDRDRIPAETRIQLTLDDLRQLQIGFAALWQRPPSEREMLTLIENRIKEEILYREALAMGLDKDDSIVKRRMAQKMQFVAEDISSVYEPTGTELLNWFEKNSAMFEEPARVTFRTLYFSPDRRGPNARADAAKALASLAGRNSAWPGTTGLADPFMLPDYLPDRTPEAVGKEFGPEFANVLFDQTPGVWAGPIESGFGWHIVFLESLMPARVPAFEEVEPDVKTAWLAARKAEAWEEAYEKMRAKYELILPAPAEGAAGATPYDATRTRTP
jgi:peptidyl-prolyl cis-trans isomerase C